MVSCTYSDTSPFQVSEYSVTMPTKTSQSSDPETREYTFTSLGEVLLYLRLVSRFIGLDSTKQEDSCYLHVVTRLKQNQSNGGPAVQ